MDRWPGMTFSRQWLRCDKRGWACRPIGGATYTIVRDDRNPTLRFQVTARCTAGEATAILDPTGRVTYTAAGGAAAKRSQLGAEMH
jgi:hypothetical protein